MLMDIKHRYQASKSGIDIMLIDIKHRYQASISTLKINAVSSRGGGLTSSGVMVQGEEYGGCIKFGDDAECRNRVGDWIDCDGSPVVARRGAGSGSRDECAFPYVYGNEVRGSCVRLNGDLQCQNVDGMWIACDERSTEAYNQAIAPPPPTLSGTCAFPFVYEVNFSSVYEVITR